MADADILSRQQVISGIMNNPSLSKHDKHLAIAPILKGAKKEIHDLTVDLHKTEKELENIRHKKECVEIIEQWLKNDSFKLEKNDCSRLHKLKGDFLKKRIVIESEPNPERNAEILFKDMHSFVVQNDWASAFDGSNDFDGGEIRLPYSICAFEFRISGKNVIVLTYQSEDQTDTCAMPFVQADDYWICYEKKAKEMPPFQLAWKQIRAISIALDAEVAETDVIRAPHRLNIKREKSGKLPLFDYRVVKLGNRHRVKTLSSDSNIKTRKRLHFRRGHWRHFETSKTWIKWTLVGNPDLGFVDKEYRL